MINNYIGLNLLQQLIASNSQGLSILCTDGNGKYWASIKVYSPETGEKLPNANVQIDMSVITNASNLLQQFQALVANATVTTNPFT